MGFQYRTFKTCAFAFWPVASSDTHKQLSDTAELTQRALGALGVQSATAAQDRRTTKELGTPLQKNCMRGRPTSRVWGLLSVCGVATRWNPASPFTEKDSP